MRQTEQQEEFQFQGDDADGTPGLPERRRGLASLLPLGVLASFGVAVLAVVTIGVFSLSSLKERTEAADAMSHTQEVIEQVVTTLSLIKDAETGQRGFLLAGSEAYLQPFTNGKTSVEGMLRSLQTLTADNPRQQRRIEQLGQLWTEKLQELQDSIALKRQGKDAAVMELVRSDRGLVLMDRIRGVVGDVVREEQDLAGGRRTVWQRTAETSLAVTLGGSTVLLVLIASAAVMTSRNYRMREQEAWLRSVHAGLGQTLQGDRSLDSLADKALSYLARRLGAQGGALFMAQGGGFERIAGYAMQSGRLPLVAAGEGLVGQAARNGRALHVRDVPAGYWAVGSGLGEAAPAELLLMPVAVNGVVECVLELGFFRRTVPAELLALERVSETLGMALRAAIDRSRLEELLEETRRQAEELQHQQEELQSSNVELEEQSRALRESQLRLEAQHAELEQTNVQLEEQSQRLEIQREDLTRAQAALTEKAEQLERTSQYKSEFLANMSHELRTPLNSTLILAKLLADNRGGNLSEEQVRFARTISAAGNDLLVLVNDILDISKIEAGKLDVSIEEVPLHRVAQAIETGFVPVARQRGLDFKVECAPGLPACIDTDEARLGQILRNLIANALKFTETGGVSLTIGAAPGGRHLSFAVRDTGIGIAESQQAMIFEAFRQADGSTHRKYGGTGLGLSISRTLAQLLGGDIGLQSRLGEGSTFTLTLPARQGLLPEPLAMPQRWQEAPVAPAATVHEALEDDREQLAQRADPRTILVIEDDPHFAAVLRDLVREMGFPVVLADRAADGLRAAEQYRPSAIVLDMKLPDMSGFAVLEQLKRTPALRHIPVHVISVGDYAQEVLQMGAAGYALKPVKRDELEQALRRLEAKVAQALRRVLVVEDDARQREAIEQLLGSEEVEIVGVSTAAAALDALHAGTFDCMVMDLHLPDVSGFELLERMAGQEKLAFPPVIVYTGRALSRAEEDALRRFSKSIIVKGARSPERLLDEVTLFLHQVESKLPPERQRMLVVAREREALLEGRRVLIVEDDVRNIFALSAALEPKGMKIEIARNGREALQALARQPIDMVLMDVMMPEMDGIAATREIRKQPQFQRLPIIALTAKAMKDDHERCLAAGANDYIAKPLDVAKLLSLMRVWMQRA